MGGGKTTVIGPMLAQKEYLALQQLQLRVVTISGGRPTEIGQAVFSLQAAAYGQPLDFDVIVERHTVPAGFNLSGTVSIVYTKTLGQEHWHGSARSARSMQMQPRPPSQQPRSRSKGSTSLRSSCGDAPGAAHLPPPRDGLHSA